VPGAAALAFEPSRCVPRQDLIASRIRASASQGTIHQSGNYVVPDWKTTGLFKWLKEKNEQFAARVAAVREELTKWLPYILTIYPHYPGHGVEHSDRIISQLSRLLFREDVSGQSSPKPVANFSAAEVYCLICSAYLHDMGMVVSPGEQAEILASEAWKSFVVEGGKGQEAYSKYIALRTQAQIAPLDKSHFLADTALRYVIADFIRRDHHERGVTTLQMHEFLKQLVDHGDAVAFETIAAICAGHGLDDRDIADKERFPEERDVFGEKVNVRFLARLLRIGDLLDMDTRRSDPMSAKAVAPLPPDATPHWRQYSTKKHENVTPEAIEFRFECKDQETHRILRDWLGLLETEVRATALGQMHSRRHRDWTPPKCAVASQPSSNKSADADQGTIIIKPASGAVYAFHDWRIEMDQQAVLDLLIRNVYGEHLAFVRELIQNALDATRCRMYADFEDQNPGAMLPERPTRFPAEFRNRYPLRLSLTHEPVKLTPDGPSETRPVFTIEDSGTGMDERIITRYFLQVGRSYYKSRDFRQRFKFVPTSRFGIGFLSVFAVSDKVTVETACRDPESGELQGTRLTLREPRNYLLTEPWRPFEERAHVSRTGTRIRVVVNRWPKESKLIDLVRRWCVAVEVPLIVIEGEASAVLQPERWTNETILAQSRVDSKGRFIVKAFDVNHHGIEGQIGLVAYEDDKGEGWCDCWSNATGLDGQRLERRPALGRGYQSLHGILVGPAPVESHEYSDSPQWSSRLDVRGSTDDIPLSRHVLSTDYADAPVSTGTRVDSRGSNELTMTAAQEVAQQAVSEHLAQASRAKGPRGIYYVGKVLSLAPVSDAWRDALPGTVVTWQGERRTDISVSQLLSLRQIVIPAWHIPDTMKQASNQVATRWRRGVLDASQTRRGGPRC
jgi:molecular chaperone HtpG